MTTEKTETIHVDLSLKELDNERTREKLVGALEVLGPKSALATNHPEIEAAVADVVTKHALHKAGIAKVAARRKALTNEIGKARRAKNAANRAVTLLKALVETYATDAQQVVEIALRPRVVAKSSGDPEPPDYLEITHFKRPGSFKATAHETGTRKRYAARYTLGDPANPEATWIDLPGTGKSRKLSGFAKSTALWLQFATIRGDQQSPWSTPVRVSVP